MNVRLASIQCIGWLRILHCNAIVEIQPIAIFADSTLTPRAAPGCRRGGETLHLLLHQLHLLLARNPQLHRLLRLGVHLQPGLGPQTQTCPPPLMVVIFNGEGW